MPVNNFTKMRKVLLKRVYVLAFLLFLTCPMTLAWRSFKIIFTRIDFEANAKLADVNIQLQNKSETTLNMVISTTEVLNDVEISASVALETEPGNYTNLISITLNFCKMLNERNTEPMARVVYQDMLRYGNWFKECPIQRATYTLQDYRMDEELLPSYLPETNFKFNMRLRKPKGEQIFKGTLYGRVDKSKGFNNLKMFSMG